MDIKLLFVPIFFGLATRSSFAQVAPSAPTPDSGKRVEYGFDGMLAVSVGEKTVGINVGGPSFKLRVKNLKIGVGAMPSLFIRDDKAVPRLAVGPVAEYRHLMLIVPYYGYDAYDRQIWTFGVGYKFF